MISRLASIPAGNVPTMDACEYNSLKFYKNDGKTVLDDPVDDSGFSLSDHLLPKKSFSHSLPDMVDSSADKDDPLRDMIAEVNGPPMKCQCDRIPSTNPGAEPPRDARDSGSARLHSTHLETSSSDRQ